MRLFLGLLLAVSAAWAQPTPSSDIPASKDDIQRLFVALHVRERQELILQNSHQQAQAMFAEILRKELPESSKEELFQFQGMGDEMLDDIDKNYPMDAILNDLIPIYQRHLTKPDCDELIAFYSSPVGQKLMRALPAITSESMQVSTNYLQPRMEAAVSKLKEKMERMVEEENKKAATPAKIEPEKK
jgi:hypothetical protein